MKPVLLIVAQKGYQPVEYGHTRDVIERGGYTVKVASNQLGTAEAHPSKNHTHYATAHVDVTLDNVKPEDYAGIFIVGGPGAMEYLDNQTIYAIMQKTADLKSPIGAICISPRILAHAGILKDKKATGWDGDGKVDAVFQKWGAVRVAQPVVTDGNIITADGPVAALPFGKAIVAALNNCDKLK